MSQLTHWTKNPWGAYKAKIDELGVKPLAWLNEWMVTSGYFDGHWKMEPNLYDQHLVSVGNRLPLGTPGYKDLIIDWEKWRKHSAERIQQMMEVLIRGTNHFDQQVRLAFYGLSNHKRTWANGSIDDNLYQPVIDMQGAICICLYSRGRGLNWFADDVIAATRLLKQAAAMRNGRPVIAVVQGRRDRKAGWDRIGQSELSQYFSLIASYGASLCVFGGLSALSVTRAGAESGRWAIDLDSIPTVEDYGREQADVLGTAYKATR